MQKKHRLIILISSILTVLLISFIILGRPYKIGIIISTDTSLGNEENLAAHFYENKTGFIGLHPVKLVFRTPTANNESIRNECRNLIDEKVNVIVGGSLSSFGIIIREELKDENIPFWGVSISTSKLSGIKDNFFRIVSSTDVIGESFGIHFENQGIERLIIVKSIENRHYSDALSTAILNRFKGDAEELYYQPGWEEAITPDVEAVVAILPSSSLMLVTKSVRKLLPDAGIYSTDWGFDELLSLFADEDIEGIYAISRRGKLEPEFTDLRLEFYDEIDIQPTYGAVTVFAILDIVIDGLKNAGGDPESLMEFYSIPRQVSTGYGKVFIDEFGDAYPVDIFFKQIRNSEVEIIDKFSYEK